jgi:pyrroloquinoline quinone biosynthesis protein B
VTVRHIPIEGVLVTDAEIDHTLGIVLLREGRYLPVYATPAVQSILDHDSRLLPITRAFGEVPVTELDLNTPVPLRYRDGCSSGLTVEAFSVPAGPPRFASRVEDGHTVGFILREEASGKVCAFVPGCGGLDAALLERLAQADALLFDGTFWAAAIGGVVGPHKTLNLVFGLARTSASDGRSDGPAITYTAGGNSYTIEEGITLLVAATSCSR